MIARFRPATIGWSVSVDPTMQQASYERREAGYLLWWQNQLVSQQNEYIEQQTRASQGQSVNFLLSTLTFEDDVKNEVALVQLN